jgi:hypothetical protein
MMNGRHGGVPQFVIYIDTVTNFSHLEYRGISTLLSANAQKEYLIQHEAEFKQREQKESNK